jgi:hypothetical protein
MRDAIDLSTVTILNSPDVRAWPATAMLTRLELRPTGVHVEFTKRDGADSWPDVPFLRDGEKLQYTLWIALKIAGQWYASGCIQFWRGLNENGGPPPDYANNWYYDKSRWGPMTGVQPAVGEPVGFFVTAGNARNNGASVVKERSNVVLVPFPDIHGQTFVEFEAPVPAAPSTPAPAPPAAVTSVSDDEQLTALIDVLRQTVIAVNALNTRLDALKMNGLRVHF